MTTGRIEMGPSGRAVAANVKRLRAARGLSLRALSEALAEVGRSLSPDAINKIENGADEDTQRQIRRVDADDLTAFALVFNVSPLSLLLPAITGNEQVELTAEKRVAGQTAWTWGLGRGPAMDRPALPGYPIGPGDDPVSAAEADAREQEYHRLRAEYLSLALPPALRRAAEHPAVQVAQQLVELAVDLAMPRTGDDAEIAGSVLRMAKRRYQQLGIELDEIEDQLKS
ncbi:helix-turn-helix domain-containing protein [Streptomyces sp. NPDC020817]|uniref:helix-turn-helix domain-containing protein n=1 Tax=Streptomyces sp. NPDC020817 TaxID=3365095 RepID=UPI0037894991